MIKSAALFLLLVAFVTANDEEYQRDIRQSPVFFQPGRGGAPPKGQPFPGTLVPKFVSFGGAPPQGFRPAPQVDEEDEEEIDKNSIAPSQSTPPQQVLHFRQSQASPHQVLQFRPTSPLPPLPQQPIASAQVLQPQQTLVLKGRPNQQDFQLRRPQQIKNQLIPQALSEEELEEKEEPDRLTELLPQSKFSCNGKKTGYYADDGLNCEVFHYCQDNARHSWICPEGFSFHQVHLICMPPSSDNICQQSSQFHFVNDFLYRPINAEEAHNRPNVTIRYADRYYPENYYESAPTDENGDSVRHFQQRQHPAPQQQPQVAPPRGRVTQQPFQPSLRPLAQIPQQFTRQPFNQVYHSPEEVNIPLQNRRLIATGSTPRGPPPTQPSNYDFENE